MRCHTTQHGIKKKRGKLFTPTWVGPVEEAEAGRGLSDTSWGHWLVRTSSTQSTAQVVFGKPFMIHPTAQYAKAAWDSDHGVRLGASAGIAWGHPFCDLRRLGSPKSLAPWPWAALGLLRGNIQHPWGLCPAVSGPRMTTCWKHFGIFFCRIPFWGFRNYW